jgi:hypothetical protein
LVSGTKGFINGILWDIGPTCRLIISVLIRLHSATLRGHWKDCTLAKELLSQHNLHPVPFPDADNEGATDVCHVFGFGGDLVSNVLLASSMDLTRTLHHFLDGGTVDFFPEMAWVHCLSVLVVSKPPRRVLWHLDAVLGEGLFPCSQPPSLVYCPSYFSPQQ